MSTPTPPPPSRRCTTANSRAAQYGPGPSAQQLAGQQAAQQLSGAQAGSPNGATTRSSLHDEDDEEDRVPKEDEPAFLGTSGVRTTPIGAIPNPTIATTLGPSVRNASTQPPALVEAVLKLCRSLVTGSSRARLRVSHADALRDVVLHLCSSPEPSIAIAAYGLLSALGSPATLGPASAASAGSQPQHAVILSSVLQVIREGTAAPEVMAEAWTTLPTLTSGQTQERPAPSELLSLIQRELASDNEALRAAALRLLTMALSPESRTDRQAPEHVHPQALLSVLRTAVRDTAPSVRRVAAGVAADLVKQATRWPTSQGSVGSQLRPGVQVVVPALVAAMQPLLKDVESAVRADAIRALGLVVQNIAAKGEGEDEPMPHDASTAPWTQQAIDSASLALLGPSDNPESKGLCQDEVPLVRLRASWALGNLCAAHERLMAMASLPISPPEGSTWSRLLSNALVFASDDERLSPNGLRALGSLLHIADPAQLHSPSSSAAVEDAVRILCSSLADTKASPKARWNAASALGKALTNEALGSSAQGLEPDEMASQRRAMCDVLSSALLERNFKVVLTAASALQEVEDVSGYGGEASRQVCEERTRRAKDGFGLLLRQASFGEAQMHGKTVEEALDKLASHLKGLRPK